MISIKKSRLQKDEHESKMPKETSFAKPCERFAEWNKTIESFEMQMRSVTKTKFDTLHEVGAGALLCFGTESTKRHKSEHTAVWNELPSQDEVVVILKLRVCSTT
jgi:hypothetical protein